jgi:hypothetical protein
VARGFESKDVEQQQQEAQERRARARRPEPPPEQIERERKRDSLQLQRTRVLHEIEACKDDRRLKILKLGLKYLDEQLALLPAKT